MKSKHKTTRYKVYAPQSCLYQRPRYYKHKDNALKRVTEIRKHGHHTVLGLLLASGGAAWYGFGAGMPGMNKLAALAT